MSKRSELPPRGWVWDRRVPLALIFTALFQAAGIVWWAAAKQQQDQYQDTRIGQLEQISVHGAPQQTEVLERLARIEARLDAQLDLIRRLDRQAGER